MEKDKELKIVKEYVISEIANFYDTELNSYIKKRITECKTLGDLFVTLLSFTYTAIKLYLGEENEETE